jgi:hypothetical protein
VTPTGLPQPYASVPARCVASVPGVCKPAGTHGHDVSAEPGDPGVVDQQPGRSPPAGWSSTEVEDDAAAHAASFEEAVCLGGLLGREDPGHPEGQDAVLDLLA